MKCLIVVSFCIITITGCASTTDIELHIRDANTHKPVSFARVWYEPKPELGSPFCPHYSGCQSTDNEGVCRLVEICNVAHLVKIDASGYDLQIFRILPSSGKPNVWKKGEFSRTFPLTPNNILELQYYKVN